MTDPILSASDAQKQIERNFKWNFAVNALDGASFWFGISFIAPTIILPLYISHFTDNPILIGLIPFLSTSGYLIPQLFVANVVEQAPVKKFFPVNLGFFLERLPMFLMIPSAYFLAIEKPILAMISLLLLYTWHSLGGGMVIIGWQDMIAKIIPLEKRGRFFGITNFIGNGSGILGALAVPVVLERFAFPTGYVISFSVASVLIFLSWVFLALTREPPVASARPAVSQGAYLRTLPGVLRKDPNFRKYLLAQIVFTLSGMATGFLAVYTTRTWNLPDAQASQYTIAMQIGLALANLFFGFMADRKGHKLNLELSTILSVVSLVLAVLAPSPVWFFLVFFLRGAVSGVTFVSGISIVYEFTGAENRATYIGLANTIPGIAGAVAPLAGGWLAGSIGYQWMFAIAALAALLSLGILHYGVREPRKISLETLENLG